MLRDSSKRYDVVVDLGCGRGDCARSLDGLFATYIGCDVVKYEGFPEQDTIQFRPTDLNRPPDDMNDACADAVVSSSKRLSISRTRAPSCARWSEWLVRVVS